MFTGRSGLLAYVIKEAPARGAGISHLAYRDRLSNIPSAVNSNVKDDPP